MEVVIMPRKIISNELKQEIINFYLSRPMSQKELSDKFNLSLPTIGKILKDTPKYSKARVFNPDLVEDYFQTIDSEEKAYFYRACTDLCCRRPLLKHHDVHQICKIL